APLRKSSHETRATAQNGMPGYFFWAEGAAPAAGAAAPAGACAGFAAAPASAAFGSGAGLSDFEFRNAITSARSLPRGRPAKLIVVPGTKPLGFVRKVLRSSIVQLPGLPFMPAE